VLDHAWLFNASKIFTVVSVLFPTFGCAIAEIRYFGAERTVDTHRVMND
jgi:hypothetical protein